VKRVEQKLKVPRRIFRPNKEPMNANYVQFAFIGYYRWDPYIKKDEMDITRISYTANNKVLNPLAAKGHEGVECTEEAQERAQW
jgi:hypothetical protein